MSELRKLNKDLLIKLIEEINDPEKLSIEELKEKIRLYDNTLGRKIHKIKSEHVINFILNLSAIPELTELIEKNRDEILKMEFPFINSSTYMKRIIKFKGKSLTFEEWKTDPLFNIKLKTSNLSSYCAYDEIWVFLLMYVYSERDIYNIQNHKIEKVECPKHGHPYHIKFGNLIKSDEPRPEILVTSEYKELKFIPIHSHECF